MNDATRYKILMVDDEPNVLSGYQRTVGRVHSLTIAEGGAAGLKAIATSGPYAVVITDMRMPVMTGLEFLEAARAAAKETVFMMLTGNADQQTAVDAINHGQIFRFLNKPCAPELLDSAIRAGIRQYELVTAERVLLRETFSGSIKLLLDAIELSNPSLATLQSSVKNLQQEVCTALGIPRDWQLSIAGSLSLLGLVTVPGFSLGEAIPNETLKSAAVLGHRLLTHIPRLASVATIISRQRDPGLLPRELSLGTIESMETIGAQLLRFTVDLAIKERLAGSRSAAVKALSESRSYDPRLISAVRPDQTESKPKRRIARDISVMELAAGMEIAGDIKRSDGTLVLSDGQQLTELSVVTLNNYYDRRMIGRFVKILVAEEPNSAVPEGQCAA